MGRAAFRVALASLMLATGCGGSAQSTGTAASSSSQTTASASAATSTSPAGSASGQATVLTGTVGSKDNPDAFVITLAEGSGRPVGTLPAGKYQIQVHDLSKIHNFHLKGGTVDETTTVPEITDTTFDVTLAPGNYTFVCDPHPRMVGQFSVT